MTLARNGEVGEPRRRDPADAGEPADHGVLRILEVASKGWPPYNVSLEEFARHMARHAETAEPAQGVLKSLDVQSAWLAFASLKGDARALAAFDQSLGEAVGLAARRLKLTSDESEDFRQVMRVQLLVGLTPSGPKLARFSGRGSLISWLRVVVLREAYRLQKRVTQVLELEPALLEAQPDDAAGPESLAVMAQHRQAFREAFQGAICELRDEDRNLLRHVILDEASLTELGKLYGVDRTTIGRRIKKIRDLIYKRTRQRLMCDLGIPGSEVDSVMRAAQSRQSLSLSRLLVVGDS